MGVLSGVTTNFTTAQRGACVQGITEEQMVFLPVKMVDETTAIKSADYLIIYGR